MIRKLGFTKAWISIIMKCVTTIFYATLINSQPGATFTPSRGLHQGDPISPYLYRICAEGFSLLLNEVEKYSKIKGIRMLRGSPSINHLFFANDTIFFIEPPLKNGGKFKVYLTFMKMHRIKALTKAKLEFFSNFFQPQFSPRLEKPNP